MHDNGSKLTGIAFPTQLNVAKIDVVAYRTRQATDTAWTASSGEGTSLATQGVYVHVYRYNGVTGDPLSGNLAAGVEILRVGAMIPNDDYYFSDADADRTTIDTGLTATGANGTGLVLRQPSLVPYAGTPGPLSAFPGCTWYTSIGGVIPGVVFAQIHNPVGTDCDF
jgi:hypothetical protein